MNTTTAAQAIVRKPAQARSAAQHALPSGRVPARISSLALAAALTLVMLAGIDTLAIGDSNNSNSTAAPQWAQSSTSRA